MDDRQSVMKQFEKVKDLDSKVFIEIPQKKITNINEYKWWLSEFQEKWISEYNNKNERYHPSRSFWNDEEGGISGYFGEEYISHCKFYRYDGTLTAWSKDDFRAKRGFLIRDHYTKHDVVKVQHISNNLEDFLKKEKIKYKRTNFKKRC